jgi:hypothetical protein
MSSVRYVVSPAASCTSIDSIIVDDAAGDIVFLVESSTYEGTSGHVYRRNSH